MLIELGNKIKYERLKKNLTIEDFANYMCTTDIAVKLWESGRMSPRLSQLIKMSVFFNVSTDYLLGLKS